MPKPKKAFQSPGTQSAGPFADCVAIAEPPFLPRLAYWIALITLADCATQPKMPPWAAIILKPTS